MESDASSPAHAAGSRQSCFEPMKTLLTNGKFRFGVGIGWVDAHLLTASLVSSPYHVRLEHRSGLAIERSLEASFADVVGDQRLGAQPAKVEADDVAARERSREQAGPLSVARLPRKVTPHRSPSYTPSPWPLGIAASADSKSCSCNVRPIAWGK